MGILNTSPESFYKKSIMTDRTSIRDAVVQMQDDKADFIDIGGMSTAPYLTTIVSEETELDRVINAVKIAQDASNLPISVDTCRAGIAKAVLNLGVEIINDISGLKYDPGMPAIISKFAPSVVLCAYDGMRRSKDNDVCNNHDATHRKGVVNNDVIYVTRRLLGESIEVARQAGIAGARIVLDPAIGFFRKGGTKSSGSGHTTFLTRIDTDWMQRDLRVMANLEHIRHQGLPILVSVSNKSFLEALLQKKDPVNRLYGSIAAEAACVMCGANIIRTHNVRQTKDATIVASGIIDAALHSPI